MSSSVSPGACSTKLEVRDAPIGGTGLRCGNGARPRCNLAIWYESSGCSLRLVAADVTIVRRMMILTKLNDAVSIEPTCEAFRASFRPTKMDTTS